MLFKIEATYAKQVRATSYFVYESSKRRAVKYFLDTFPWLKIIEDVSESNLDVSNPYKYIVIGKKPPMPMLRNKND